MFDDGLLRGLSHGVWDTLYSELDYKIPKKTLYISVLQNRHQYQSKLKENLVI